MSKVLTIGEAMGLLIAEEMGPLEEVEHFSRIFPRSASTLLGSASATSSRPMISMTIMSGPMTTI